MSSLALIEDLLLARDVEELGRRFLTGAASLLPRPMLGLYLLDPHSQRPHHIATTNVSDLFVARYEQVGRTIDPVLEHALSRRSVAYNLALMPLERWRHSAVYRSAAHIDRFAQVVIAPVVVGDRVVGTVNVGDSDPAHEIDADELERVELLRRSVGLALHELDRRRRLERRARRGAAALEHVPTPLALTSADEPRPVINAAGRTLLGDAIDPEAAIYELLARSGPRRIPRTVDVALRNGGRAHLRGVSQSVAGEPGAMLTFIERADGSSRSAALAALTPREREVAELAANDLTDAEIARRLRISVHTVGQHLKRAYRKLGVRSRVGLTRLVVAGAHASHPWVQGDEQAAESAGL